MDKFNFVFFLDKNDYQKICYSQLEGRSDVQIVFDWNLDKIFKVLHRIHMSPKINGIIKLPFKKIWYKWYYKKKFSVQRPLCFVFDTCLLQIYGYYDYINYLKRQYESSKMVLFYQDLIKTFPSMFRPDVSRKYFDLLISYDKSDSDLYKIEYHPTVSSPVIFNYFISDEYKSDVYCLAQAKDRLKTFMDICDSLMRKGVECKFLLSRVPRDKRESHKGIVYLDKPIPYLENLKYVLKTNCILEIMQNGAVGYTLRLWEAILYDKKLLTNNTAIRSSNYYNPSYISVIDHDQDLKDLDIDFLKSSNKYENQYKDLVGPNNLLLFINDYFQSKSRL